MIVPVPKEGNLQSCDNWQGISLLDVVGKVMGRVFQERLQVITEELLPDSQCKFWRVKGCMYGRVRLRMIINDYQSCTTANHTKLQL